MKGGVYRMLTQQGATDNKFVEETWGGRRLSGEGNE